ncbi:MAG: hypothetical protein Kow00133_03460 [Amphiplicatus sp.]
MGFASAKKLAALGAGAALAACATPGPERAPSPEPQWAANGWLTPGPTGEPEIIGLYVTRKQCEAAVEDWLSRQVVGNPVYGECLPIDRR